jgi:hypothetical protein
MGDPTPKIIRRDMALVLIGLVYCVLSLLYAVLTPPWEAPDEPAHYLYISQLSSRWRPPPESSVRQTTSVTRDHAYVSSNYEWYQPPLGYLPAAIVYSLIEFAAPGSLPRKISPVNPRISSDPMARNLFLNENPRLFQNWRGNQGLLVLRITSAVWGLVVIGAAYYVGNLLDTRDRCLGLVSAACVAFLPQFTFINATVRSDTVTNALAALFVLAAGVALVHPERRHACALAMGALLGLGLLSKYTFVYMVPVGVMAAVLSGSRVPRRCLKTLSFMVVPAVCSWSAYFLTFEESRRAVSYMLSTVLKIRADALTWDYVARIPRPLLIDLFYARFGWANVIVPDGWARLGFTLWAGGSILTACQCVKTLRRAEANRSCSVVLLCAGAMGLALAGVLRFNLAQFQPQGRLLFPVLVPWAILGLWGGWQTASPRGKLVIGIGAIGFLLSFNLYALFFALLPAYY